MLGLSIIPSIGHLRSSLCGNKEGGRGVSWKEMRADIDLKENSCNA
jgi:hypothetical protein